MIVRTAHVRVLRAHVGNVNAIGIHKGHKWVRHELRGAVYAIPIVARGAGQTAATNVSWPCQWADIVVILDIGA